MAFWLFNVMEQVCGAFSPLEHFTRLKDGTSRKVREAALEYLVKAQDSKKNDLLLQDDKKKIIIN